MSVFLLYSSLDSALLYWNKQTNKKKTKNDKSNGGYRRVEGSKTKVNARAHTHTDPTICIGQQIQLGAALQYCAWNARQYLESVNLVSILQQKHLIIHQQNIFFFFQVNRLQAHRIRQYWSQRCYLFRKMMEDFYLRRHSCFPARRFIRLSNVNGILIIGQ